MNNETGNCSSRKPVNVNNVTIPNCISNAHNDFYKTYLEKETVPNNTIHFNEPI